MFETECRAYTNLIHYRLCNEGLVPSFYGVVDFPRWKHQTSVYNTRETCSSPPPPTGGSEVDLWAFFRQDIHPPKAILIEYLPDMKHLGLRNLSVAVANESLRILARIHEAQILHGDFLPRNILVGDNDRVVIVRMHSSECNLTRCLLTFSVPD